MGPFSSTTRIMDRVTTAHYCVMLEKELKPSIYSKYRGMLTNGVV
jgi:hypothetical protein